MASWFEVSFRPIGTVPTEMERGSAKEEMSALQLAGHAPSGKPPRSVSAVKKPSQPSAATQRRIP